jgi:hypothetical protein
MKRSLLIYPEDYLTSTMHFSTLQHGMYVRLLMFRALNGILPEEGLARVAGVTARQWSSDGGAVWAALNEDVGRHRPNPASVRTDRLRQAQAKGRHTPEQWERLLDYCGHRCVKCGDGPPVKDHILALYLEGSDAIDNLQPLCLGCNSAKGPDATDYRPDGWQGVV